jgi:hypothetical protein
MNPNYRHINSDLYATMVPNIDKIPNTVNESKFNSDEQLQLEILYKKMIAPLNDLEQLNIGAARYRYYPVKAPVIYNEELYKQFTNYVNQKRVEDSTKTASLILNFMNDVNTKMKLFVDSINQPIVYTIQDINKNPKAIQLVLTSLEEYKLQLSRKRYNYQSNISKLKSQSGIEFNTMIEENTFYKDSSFRSLKDQLELQIRLNDKLNMLINTHNETKQTLLSSLELYKPKDYVTFIDLDTKMLNWIQTQKNLLGGISIIKVEEYYYNVGLFYEFLVRNFYNLKIKKMDSWEELLSIMKSNGFTSTYFDKSN